MINQKFVPAFVILNDLIQKCNPDSPYFHTQFDSDQNAVESNLLALEDRLISVLDMLSEKKRPDLHIQNLEDVSCFLLYVTIRIAFMYGHADVQLFPLIPESEYWKNIFAYLQYTYLEYRKHCSQNNINLWESILEYEVDLYCND